MIIGITQEETIFGEQEKIITLLESKKVDFFHIRKHDFSEEQMREYLTRFPKEIREKLCLHSHHILCKEMGIGGVHLNSHCPNLLEGLQGKRVSCSCHSIEEFVQKKDGFEYCFLSPVFDSFSKQGYKSAFASKDLKQAFLDGRLDGRCVALGGVDFENIDILRGLGFENFAMLSAVWKYPMTMFISHQNERYSYLQSMMTALEGGLKFIQLRMKDATEKEILDTAQELRPYVDKHHAILTIDDHVELLQSGLFDGVHIGKEDMPIAKAREIIGKGRILGATCNTLEDVLHAIDNDVDYIGLGPYTMTSTKKKLSPLLGIEGYRKIISSLNDKQKKTPIYAIGGITQKDLLGLKEVGVYGVAISSVILQSQDPIEVCHKFREIF